MFKLIATSAAALVLVGCAARPTKSIPGSAATGEVTTWVGQMQYRSAEGRSVIGEFAAGSSPGGVFALEMRSGPGLPLLKLREAGDQADVEGLLARAGWRGTAARAPAELQGWLALDKVFAEVERGRQGKIEVPGAAAVITLPDSAGERIAVTAAGGESFTLQVSR